MANLQFELGSGRKVSISGFGDPASERMVLFCHPTPGAAGFDPDPLITAAAGVQVLGMNRPGYAGSDPVGEDETPSVQQFADDLAEYVHRTAATARELSGQKFGRVGVVGWSFGGSVALSFAARHPDLVGSVAVIGTSRPSRIRRGDPTTSSLELSPRARATTVSRMLKLLPDDPPHTIESLGIADNNVALARLGVRNRLQHMLDDAFLHNMVGVATDRVAARDTSWSRELGSIEAKTLIIHGESDPVAGPGDRRWFRRHIPNARTIAVQGAGHLAVVTAWGKILEHVAPEN